MSRLQKLEAFLQLVETQIYSEPEEGNFHTALIEDLVPKIVDPLQLPKDAMVLDVGCGYGAFMNLMRTRGYTNVTGITLSKEDLDACRRRGLRAVPMDLSFLDFADGSVDFIWCRHALEHSPFPYFTLLEYRRALKEGGRLYVEVPAPDNDRLHEFNANHYSILGITMWKALFQRTGFVPLLLTDMKFKLSRPGQEKPFQEHYYVCLLQKQRTGQTQVGASCHDPRTER
jgi:SAM-dependent methyltransferase